MGRHAEGLEGTKGLGEGAIMAVRQRKVPVAAVGEENDEEVLRSAMARLPPSVSRTVYRALTQCMAQVASVLAPPRPFADGPSPGAYRISKARGAYVIRCANGTAVCLPNTRCTRLLLMALANVGMPIPYVFLAQAGETGPWKLSGYAGTGRWNQSSSAQGDKDETGERDDDLVGYEEDLHLAGNVMQEATDRKAIKAYRERLMAIREERRQAEGDSVTLAKLDEEAEAIGRRIEDDTRKTGAIRKKGMNAKEQRQFHACFERAIRIVSDQNSTLGEYLNASVARGAKFQFNGASDEFIFDDGVLSSPQETARNAASLGQKHAGTHTKAA